MWDFNLKNAVRRFLLQPKRLAIVEAALIGLVSAFAVVLLKQGVALVGGWRVAISHRLPAWWVLPAIGFFGGAIAGWLIERLAPETTGSGIPQVKAALAQAPVRLDLRVACIKLLGAVLTLGAGLPLGREGPTIQVSASLAAQLSRWFPTSPTHRRQLIAAGASAGLAASFGTPIAGVLFAVEGLFQDVSGFAVGTEILASFIGSVVSRVLGGQELDFHLHSAMAQTRFTAPEIPFYLLLGVLAGILAPLFNRGILASLTLSQRILRLSLTWRIGLAGAIAGITIACLPPIFRDNAGVREMILATGSADWQTSLLALGSQGFLVLVAYGAGAPGGLFAPILLLGSALGHLIGVGEVTLLGTTPAITYAFVGMGAFFSATNRVPITAVAIIFEMTTDFNLVLPLMICSVVAYFVADRASNQSLVDHLLEWRGIRLQASSEPGTLGSWANVPAAEVMQKRVETLSSQMSLDQVLQAFARSHHRGFPVVDDTKLVGIVTQSDLANLPTEQPLHTIPLREIMTRHPVSVNSQERLIDVLSLLSRSKLSRLPVTAGRRLVGIITRSDILRAESNHLSGIEKESPGPRAAPSYLIYQTRAPSTGQGRLLMPLTDADSLECLMYLAAAIARRQNYEIECLNAIQIPRHIVPDEAHVNSLSGRRLLQKAARLGRWQRIPVHTQIRLAHEIAQTTLETIEERHIDVLMMLWKGYTFTPGRVFGDTVDTAIRQADCEVVLVKPGKSVKQRLETAKLMVQRHPKKERPLPSLLNQWLVLVAGGPNAQAALQFMPAFCTLSDAPEVTICQVFQPDDETPDTTALEQAKRFLSERLDCPVKTRTIRAESVVEVAVEFSQENRCDAIVLGASREGMLAQAVRGNIPEAIARRCDCTVILVRQAVDRKAPIRTS